MKTLTRTITLFVVFGITTAGFALAQAVETPAEPLPAPAPALPPSTPDVEPAEAASLERPSSGFAGSYGYGYGGGYGMGGGGWLPQHSGTGTVLVIPAAEIETEDLATITQDLNVMSRLLERNLQRANIATVGGSFFTSGRDMFTGFFMRGQQTIQSIYLQGYGALFLMKVDFPLSPPPKVQEQEQEQEKQTPEADVDPVWEQMKREMYEPEEVSRRRRGTESPAEKYDAEKVENLKTTLIKALKHAANISALKPDESAILSITGGGEFASPASIVTTRRRDDTRGDGTIIETTASSDSSPTVLVIRVRKSDIDAFANGDLDVDQFKQKTQILTYPLLGGNIGDTSSISLTVPAIRRGSRSSGRTR